MATDSTLQKIADNLLAQFDKTLLDNSTDFSSCDQILNAAPSEHKGGLESLSFLLDGLAVIVRKFKQIPVPGGRDGVPSIWRQVLFRDLPTFQRLASYLVISGKADPCTVFPEMQIAFIVDKVDRFFYLLHQHPPSNSSENLLRPSASQDSSTVAL